MKTKFLNGAWWKLEQNCWFPVRPWEFKELRIKAKPPTMFQSLLMEKESAHKTLIKSILKKMNE